MKWNSILILAFLIISCQSTPSEESSSDEDNNIPSRAESKPPVVIPELGVMVTSVDNLRLREKPGSEGKELMRLPERSVVNPTGNTTDLKQLVSLRGMSYNEPWVEVAINDNITGWIFAGALDLQPNSSQLAKRLFDDRCKRFFKTYSNEMSRYRKNFSDSKTALELNSVFLEGLDLQIPSSENFDSRCKVSNLPLDIDLLWVNAAFPGFSLTKVEEMTEVRFLADINQFIEKAEKTESEDDDHVFKFLKEINGGYSLLMQFRDWFEQTTDYGGVSKLGSGLHTKYLDQAENLFNRNNLLIEGIVTEECNLMVQDIVSNSTGYQQGKDAVLSEIEQILAKDYKILTSEQKTLIENRVKQFSDLKANKIIVNEKVGIQ